MNELAFKVEGLGSPDASSGFETTVKEDNLGELVFCHVHYIPY